MKIALTMAAIIFSCFLLLSCKKYKNAEDDVNDHMYLRGRLFYADNLNSDGTNIQPLPNANLNIANSPQTNLNFLFTTKSDLSGYFIFQNISRKIYELSCDTIINGIAFSGKKTISINSNTDTSTIILSPSDSIQNGLSYTVLDSLGGKIKGAEICVFSSFVLASADTCLGSLWSLPVTNDFGKSYKLNIPAGTYISIFRVTLDTLRLRARDTISIGSKGIQRKNVTLLKY